MNSVAIVVLSRYPRVFEQCRQSLEHCARGLRKILVVDRSEPFVTDGRFIVTGWETLWVNQPFSMARNGSLGLMAAWPDDVLYMGDDVQLEEPGDVEELQRVAYLADDIGILSPRIYGCCGSTWQQVSGKNFGGEYKYVSPFLVFPCVYIKRKVINEVGYLDLRFDGYGGDDIDYSKRVTGAGWKLAVTDNVRVKHGFGAYDGTVTFQMRKVNTPEEAAKASVKMEEKVWETSCGFSCD